VTPGQVVELERLNVAEGGTVELDKVLLIGSSDKIIVGSPTIAGAKVIATSKGEAKDDKVIVFKFKAKVRYRRKTGHRQTHTKVVIDEIIQPEAVQAEPVK
jgi:large subunit ribosomal protein L21